jgi:hypothetical protein
MSSDTATAYTIWTNTLELFNNNKTNIKKDVADAIAKFGAPPTELLHQRLYGRQHLRAHPYTVTRYCRSPDLAS